MRTQPESTGAWAGEDGVMNPILHHVNIKTTRLQEMIAWYELATGMKPVFSAPEMAFLTNDAANHRLGLVGIEGIIEDPDKVAHAGLHHSGFEFASLEDQLRRYETLKASGHVPHAAVDHGGTISFYYLDPDGNSVEMQSDNFEDWEASREWVRNSPEFAENPVGRFVDPDKLVVAMQEGASAEEIHRRAYEGEFEPPMPPDLRFPTAP